MTGFRSAIGEFMQRSGLKGMTRSQRRLPEKAPTSPEAVGKAECLANKHALCWKYNERTQTCNLQQRCIQLECLPDRMIGFLHTGK